MKRISLRHAALILLLATITLLDGCAQRRYSKTGATPQDFEADRFDCEYKVVGMYGGYGQMGAGHALIARDDMDRCLRSKGWGEIVGGS